jgi:hypothetical protein
MCIDDLSIAFKNGLKKKGVSMTDLQKYKWAGSAQLKMTEREDDDITYVYDNANKRYDNTIGFKSDGTKKTIPTIIKKCVCGQKLKRDHYIFNFEDYDIDENENILLDTFIKLNIMLVIGSCCIKKFMDGGMCTRCDFCDDLTRNREHIYLDHNLLRLCYNCRPYKNLDINIKCCMCKCKRKDITIKNKQFVCSLCNKGYIKCSYYACYERSYYFKIKDNKHYCKNHL